MINEFVEFHYQNSIGLFYFRCGRHTFFTRKIKHIAWSGGFPCHTLHGSTPVPYDSRKPDTRKLPVL